MNLYADGGPVVDHLLDVEIVLGLKDEHVGGIRPYCSIGRHDLQALGGLSVVPPLLRLLGDLWLATIVAINGQESDVQHWVSLEFASLVARCPSEPIALSNLSGVLERVNGYVDYVSANGPDRSRQAVTNPYPVSPSSVNLVMVSMLSWLTYEPRWVPMPI